MEQSGRPFNYLTPEGEVNAVRQQELDERYAAQQEREAQFNAGAAAEEAALAAKLSGEMGDRVRLATAHVEKYINY